MPSTWRNQKERKKSERKKETAPWVAVNSASFRRRKNHLVQPEQRERGLCSVSRVDEGKGREGADRSKTRDVALLEKRNGRNEREGRSAR